MNLSRTVGFFNHSYIIIFPTCCLVICTFIFSASVYSFGGFIVWEKINFPCFPFTVFKYMVIEVHVVLLRIILISIIFSFASFLLSFNYRIRVWTVVFLFPALVLMTLLYTTLLRLILAESINENNFDWFGWKKLVNCRN